MEASALRRFLGSLAGKGMRYLRFAAAIERSLAVRPQRRNLERGMAGKRSTPSAQ